MTSSDPSAIGIMEGAYFVSKRDLLEWLRNDFGLNTAKIDECGNGVVYLKILDRLYPGKVPLKKVKLNAKQEWECLHNLKILQSVFQDCGIRKHIDIDRVAKCQMIDNLEILQWFKCYYDRFSGEPTTTEDVNGTINSFVAGTTMLGRSTNHSSGSSNTRPLSRPVTSTPNSRLTQGTVRSRQESGGSHPRPTSGNISRPLVSPQRMTGMGRSFTRKDDEVARRDEEIAKLKGEVEEYKKELRTIQAELENTEKESHFYFGKLRKLELLSNEEGRTAFAIQEVQEILFSEEDLPEATLGLSGVDGEVIDSSEAI